MAATRPFVLAVVIALAGCSKKRSSNEAVRAPAQETAATKKETAATKKETAATNETAATKTTPVPTPEVSAKEAARTSGHLGPTTDQALFSDLGGSAAGSDKNTRRGDPRSDPKPTVPGGSSTDAKPAEPGKLAAEPAFVATLGTPTVVGRADGSPVRVALAKRSAEVQACYDKSRATKADLVGTLRLAFTIQSDGSLAKVAVESSTLGHAVLETCVIDVVKSTKLAKPLGTTVNGTLTIDFAKR